jgi:hypothetical protein
MNSIFIEGKDKIFIEQYLTYLFENTWNNKVSITQTNGWTKIDKFDNELKKTTDAGHNNYLIFDADSLTNNGGFVKRLNELEKKKIELNIQFETFLFPNHSEDGDFELLLERIVNPGHQKLLDCFKQYEDCISQYKNGEQYIYQLPMRKAKIYSYVDAFPKSRREKEDFKKGDYSFLKMEWWNLQSPSLNPLKEYLQRIVGQG